SQMPTTVNGIGTSYYGKKDTASRQGTCQHCGAYVKLETYTTRLWFVIIFIPVIPLKRVRLLDFCPRCNRHWVVKPEEYEMSRQLAVSGAMEKYRAEPSVDAACALHAQFLNFYMHNEADKFRESAIQAHPDNVDLLQWLAAHLDQMGRTADSTPLYEKAHALQPEIPEVRFHLAWRRIGLSRLDEAYELLDYLRLPGAGQHHNVGLLETLAESYQKAGNHERVLELCGHLLRERPTIGDQHTFRKLVAKSERAVQPEKSLLPEQAFSVRGLFDGKSGRNPPWVARTAFWGSVALLFTFQRLRGHRQRLDRRWSRGTSQPGFARSHSTVRGNASNQPQRSGDADLRDHPPVRLLDPLDLQSSVDLQHRQCRGDLQRRVALRGQPPSGRVRSSVERIQLRTSRRLCVRNSAQLHESQREERGNHEDSCGNGSRTPLVALYGTAQFRRTECRLDVRRGTPQTQSQGYCSFADLRAECSRRT
ncbi:MAG: hypothetical protein NT069_21430, partial [Planctomycetota bacterium]|nr:hypothetical protein [Planctomycetota bacterium]